MLRVCHVYNSVAYHIDFKEMEIIMDNKTPITLFDILTINQSLQMLKAILPFLDFDLQKNLALIIRINELRQTMDFFSDTKNFCTIRSCVNSPIITLYSSLDNILCNDEIINTIMPYCPENYVGFIKNYKQFSKMSDVINLLNKSGILFSNDTDNSQNIDFNNIINIAKSLNFSIDPEMLKNISNIYTPNNNTPPRNKEPSEKANNPPKPPPPHKPDVPPPKPPHHKPDIPPPRPPHHKPDIPPPKPPHHQPDTPPPNPPIPKPPPNNPPKKPPPPNPTERMLQNMLSPKQQEMYNSFLNQLDGIDFSKENA